jgi:hypothetical protein
MAWYDNSTKKSKKGLASKIYSGGARFGLLNAQIGAIIATLIGLGLLIYGIYSLQKKNDDKLKNEFDKKSSYVYIGFGLFMIIASWLSYFLARKNKLFAFAGGAGNFINMFR